MIEFVTMLQAMEDAAPGSYRQWWDSIYGKGRAAYMDEQRVVALHDYMRTSDEENVREAQDTLIGLIFEHRLGPSRLWAEYDEFASRTQREEDDTNEPFLRAFVGAIFEGARLSDIPEVCTAYNVLKVLALMHHAPEIERLATSNVELWAPWPEDEEEGGT